MRKKVVRMGNSAGITISPEELKALGLSVGSPVEVTVRAGTLEARPVSKFAGQTLDELADVLAPFEVAR